MGRFAGHFDHLLPQLAEDAAQGTAMHILIDTTNGRALARHESHKALTALHYIQFANVDAAVIRCGQNRVYSQFSSSQLESIYQYAGGTRWPKEYSDQIKAVRDLLENAPWLLLPFALEQLEAQANVIHPNETRPMAYDPGGGRPVVLQRWHSEPQVNRARCDSSFWIEFAAGTGQSTEGALPEASAGGTVRKRNTPPTPRNEDNDMAAKPAAKKATKKVAKKTAPAKKAAAKKTAPAKRTTDSGQEERNGVKRPKPGGNTAQVWDACDALKAKKGSAPTFKEVDEYIEKKNADIPTATRRSNYAVWRKFHGISGRVS